MVRLQITLDANEARLLAEWAATELRDPRDQIRLIVRESLQQRGFLPSAKSPHAPLLAEADKGEAVNDRG